MENDDRRKIEQAIIDARRNGLGAADTMRVVRERFKISIPLYKEIKNQAGLAGSSIVTFDPDPDPDPEP